MTTSPRLNAPLKFILWKVGASEGARGKAMPRLEAKGDGDQHHAKHTDDDGARNLPRGETGNDEEARGGKKSLGFGQIAKFNERHGIVGDDAGILQSDQSEEESDACADAELQNIGKASISQARKGEGDSAKKSTPEMNTQPRASCRRT
jgi:hypothetical protein